MKRIIGGFLLSIPIGFVLLGSAVTYGLINTIISLVILALMVACMVFGMELLSGDR